MKRKRGQRPGQTRKRGKYLDTPMIEQEYGGRYAQDAEHANFVVHGDAGADYISFGQEPIDAPEDSRDHYDDQQQDDTPFYGLLDPQEQEYYTSVNAKLLAWDDFSTEDERALFIEAVYRESAGKELKLASSQSCSRYLERLIQVSTQKQLAGLFAEFVGHFFHLVQHRFASHCCEALFVKAAQELDSKDGSHMVNGEFVGKQKTEGPSLEQLFLTAVDELEPYLAHLLTERFASHVVRVLLLVLSGEPLDDASAGAVLASRKKEKIELVDTDGRQRVINARLVPPSFREALKRLTSSSSSGLDTTYVRILATHPTGNPTLQVLIRLELLQHGRSKGTEDDSMIRRLLPDASLEEDSDTAKFISGILFDPIGSRLLEVIVTHAPGKMFKKLYGNLLKSRMRSMVKNESANYVAIRVLERLSAADLETARDEILSEAPVLLARNRLSVIRVLLERCSNRRVDLQPIVLALQQIYTADAGTFLLKMLQLESEGKDHNEDAKKHGAHEGLQAAAAAAADMDVNRSKSTGKPDRAANVHGVHLAITLCKLPATSSLVHEAVQSLPVDTLLQLAQDSCASRLLQQVVLNMPLAAGSTKPQQTTNKASAANKPSTSPASSTFRPHKNQTNYLSNMLLPHIPHLSTHPSASHLIDAIFVSPTTSYFIKKRVATVLAESEELVRSSPYGKIVWRNWCMDDFIRGESRGGGNALWKEKVLSASRSDDVPADHGHDAGDRGSSRQHVQTKVPKANLKTPVQDKEKPGNLPNISSSTMMRNATADSTNGENLSPLELAKLRFMLKKQQKKKKKKNPEVHI